MFKFITESEAFGLMGTKEHEEYNRTLNEIQSTNIKLIDIIFQYNEENYDLSVMFTKTGEVVKELRFNLKNSVGRPSKGITKKVSITTNQVNWDFIEEYCELREMSRSELFSEIITYWRKKKLQQWKEGGKMK